jgi:hypothetical protein
MAEDQLLRIAKAKCGPRASWTQVAEHVPGRNKKQCNSRWNQFLRVGCKTRLWFPESVLIPKKVIEIEPLVDVAAKVPIVINKLPKASKKSSNKAASKVSKVRKTSEKPASKFALTDTEAAKLQSLRQHYGTNIAEISKRMPSLKISTIKKFCFPIARRKKPKQQSKRLVTGQDHSHSATKASAGNATTPWNDSNVREKESGGTPDVVKRQDHKSSSTGKRKREMSNNNHPLGGFFGATPGGHLAETQTYYRDALVKLMSPWVQSVPLARGRSDQEIVPGSNDC